MPRSPRPPRPTLETVAEAAGVSRQTVSNVLNAPHLVRPETRQRVEEEIAGSGYRPVKAAQTLRTRRSYLIAAGMPVPAGNDGGVLDVFLRALTIGAQQRGYRILLVAAGDDQSEIRAYEDLLHDYDLDAFVLTGTHAGDERTEWLAAQRVPFVTFGRPWGTDGRPQHSWVDVDGAHGTHLATTHLIAAGHSRIAFLGWPEKSGVGDDRCAGWEQACREARLPTRGLLRRVEPGPASGRRAAAELLDSARPPTAFVCVHDAIAVDAWTEVTSRGLVPGRDIAITGFDDSAVAAAIGLSSVAQPVAEVARACLESLDKLLVRARATASAGRRARRPAPDHILLKPGLVLRGSA